MLRLTKSVWVVVMVVLIAAGVLLGTAGAKKTNPKPEDKLALGEKEVKELLLLMDTDQNGKISKQEYMRFMEAEFERLDKDKSGELDVKELTQSRLQVTHYRSR
jgi:EF hand